MELQLLGGNYNRDITFSEDGTKLFILGSDKTVHQISLGTAWDLSSYQTPDVEKDLSSILTDTYANSISFSPNGKKMFINGYGKTINEFSIATAWDLSSTVTHEGSFQLGTEIASNNFGEVVWNKDGSKLFVLDHSAEDITEYSVSTPFSLANVDQTKSAESISSVSSIRTGQSGGSGTSGSTNTALTGTYGQLTIQSNGSYSYVANQSVTDALDPGDVVYDYFTINGDTDLTITVIGINDTPSADNETNSTDVSTTLNVTDGSSDVLAGDTDDDADASLTVSAIRTGSSEGAGTAGTIGSALTGSYGALTMAADGTYTYVAGSSAGTDSFNYTVTDEFGATDIATLTITVNSSNAAPTARNDTGTVNEDATLTVADGDNANSVTAISSVRTTSIYSQETYPRDVTFNNDGTKMFVIGATDDAIDYYTLSTAYDTSTVTHQADYLRGTYTTAWSLSFNNDGTKLFIVDGDSTNAIYEYSLSTAYDLSNLTLESSRTGLTTYPTGHFFNSDGTKLFLSFNDRTIKEYSLSVGFDLSSTFTLVDTLDISSDLTGGTRGVEFNDDGTKMFVSTEADQKIFQYDLPTGFDLTNAALKGNVSHGLSYMCGFTFKPDGSQLFLARSGFGKIVTYDTASPFELTDVNGEYSGDVINTSSTANYDTDPDSDHVNCHTYST